jgi:hypothetical protein
MTPDELIDVVRAGRTELEAGISESYWVIGNIITWEDLSIIVWEAHELGMEVVLRRCSFFGGLPTFRFQWEAKK